jgi:putative Mg2+ transporter-C (MgtC) family protein
MPLPDHFLFEIEEIVLRLGVAVLFGALLGLDRELRGKSAGLRTHMLVALGAAATTLVGLQLFETLSALHPDHRGDPLRVIEGVIAAVGFLGGGAIIRDRGRAHGLTSAANIWLCGGIGLACGAGYYETAAVMFAFTLVILTVVLLIERRISRSFDD